MFRYARSCIYRYLICIYTLRMQNERFKSPRNDKKIKLKITTSDQAGSHFRGKLGPQEDAAQAEARSLIPWEGIEIYYKRGNSTVLIHRVKVQSSLWLCQDSSLVQFFFILWAYTRSTTMIEIVHFVQLVESFDRKNTQIGYRSVPNQTTFILKNTHWPDPFAPR